MGIFELERLEGYQVFTNLDRNLKSIVLMCIEAHTPEFSTENRDCCETECKFRGGFCNEVYRHLEKMYEILPWGAKFMLDKNYPQFKEGGKRLLSEMINLTIHPKTDYYRGKDFNYMLCDTFKKLRCGIA